MNSSQEANHEDVPPHATRDPFAVVRQRDALLRCPFHGEEIVMLLRHADVRAAAKDWHAFSSDAPFRVPIPSEESVRSIRQLPIETDPPDHTAYRELVAPFFQRPKSPEMITAVGRIVTALLDAALERDQIEAVEDFALALQSRALTHLLNLPEREAETWIGWGLHVFKVSNGQFKEGNVLETYLHAQFDRAEREPGEDFFSALTRAEFRGRPLTRDECMGFGNLVFAGGRDTIIHSVTSILEHFGKSPAALEFLREDPRRITLAAEEFFRGFMPLTQIGRVCTEATTLFDATIPAGGRIGLCWASANHDESVFECPGELRLDRKPNPHLAFGAGEHLCPGAAHARLVVRTVLQKLCEKVSRIEVLDAREMVEQEKKFSRLVGFQRLHLRLHKPLRSS